MNTTKHEVLGRCSQLYSSFTFDSHFSAEQLTKSTILAAAITAVSRLLPATVCMGLSMRWWSSSSRGDAALGAASGVSSGAASDEASDEA